MTWGWGWVGRRRGLGGWVLETEQMQAPPLRSSLAIHGGTGNPDKGNNCAPLRTKDLPGHRAGVGTVLQGPSCPAVQDVLPLHGGGTQPRALSWAVHAPPWSPVA